MHYETRKYIRFLHSPEGVRRRAQEVQESINAIITEAKARPSFKPDPSLLEGFPPGSVMTEARRLARNIAKDELRRRGIKFSSVESKEIKKIADTLVEADLNIIKSAKANLEKYAASSRHFRTRRGRSESHNEP